MKSARRIVAALAGALALVSACQSTPAAYGEAVMVVDTDLSVPSLVSRLRVDSFSADGTWFDTHDYWLDDPADWPASFGVYSADETKKRVVMLRLRAYADGHTREYRGERYAGESAAAVGDAGAPAAASPPSDQALQLPRLIRDGSDITPATEPEPEVAVDRLVEVVLRPGAVGNVHVLLQGACVGTMAQISAEGSFNPAVLSEASSCIDTAHQRSPLQATAPDTLASAHSSLQGTWFSPATCGDGDTSPTATCVSGGGFFLGGVDAAGDDLGSMPEHVVGVSLFWLDTNEVTVSDWRAASEAGFVSPDSSPTPLEGPLPTSAATQTPCTYSAQSRGRENYPLNCVTWAAARAYCQFRGGDLPTEAQWEYATAVAGRPYKTRYSSGGSSPPTCSQEVYARTDEGLASEMVCLSLGFGPQDVSVASGPGQDVSPLGIINLGGSMSEWTLDDGEAYDSGCWTSLGPIDPVCTEGATTRTFRGTAWDGSTHPAETNTQTTPTAAYDDIGVRCAYSSAP